MKSVETRQTLKNAQDLHLPTAAAELDTRDDGVSVLCLQLRNPSWVQFPEAPLYGDKINSLHLLGLTYPDTLNVPQTFLFSNF